MTIEELRQKVREIHTHEEWDLEEIHNQLDRLLLEYINDEEVTNLFDQDSLWYA